MFDANMSIPTGETSGSGAYAGREKSFLGEVDLPRGRRAHQPDNEPKIGRGTQVDDVAERVLRHEVPAPETPPETDIGVVGTLVDRAQLGAVGDDFRDVVRAELVRHGREVRVRHRQ